jgi:hypothetical protein
MTIRSYARCAGLAAAAAALIAGALALWLSGAPPRGAATADQSQGTTVTVTANTISWGDAAGCVQNMAVADFGALAAGTGRGAVGFRGCVTSNAGGWAVSASATDLTSANAADMIARDNLNVFTGDGSGGSGLSGSAVGGSVPCDGGTGGCGLAGPQTVLSGGSAGTGGFEYGYSLLVPGSTPGGTYTGQVTFTASN